MKLRWTSVAWSVVYLLLLLSLTIPLTVVTTFFIIVPVVLLYSTLTTKEFIVHIALVWIISSLTVGPVILLQAAYFLIPGVVMGYLYKKRASALRTILSGAGTIIGLFLLMLLISTVFFKFNLVTAIEDIFNMAMEPLQNVAESSVTGAAVWTPEMSQYFSNIIARMIPFAMIVCSLIMATVAHAVVRPALGSMGQIVPKLPPLRDWRMPRSLLWYYLVGFLLQMFGGEAVSQGFLGTILLNALPLLQFLFMIQAASLFFFAAYHRKWNPAIPVLLVVALFIVPPLRIVGILDIAFPLREMLTRPRR